MSNDNNKKTEDVKETKSAKENTAETVNETKEQAKDVKTEVADATETKEDSSADSADNSKEESTEGSEDQASEVDAKNATESEETHEVEEKVDPIAHLPQFGPGDTIEVHYKIVEGEKTRVQPFEGIVIGKKGEGVSKTFRMRKIGANNIGVERIFPLYSPNIEKIEVKKRGKVRRAKLYYLRGRKGRAATRIKELKPKQAHSAK